MLRYSVFVQLQAVCSIPVEEYLATRIAFTPDGHHIVIGHRSPVAYDILSGRAVRTYRFEGFIAPPVFSADGAYLGLVSEPDNHPGTPGIVRVFEAETGEVAVERKTDLPAGSCCFLGDVFLYCEPVTADGARHSVVRGVRLPSGDPMMELDLPDWDVRGMACGGGRLFLFGLDSAVRTRRVEGASLDYRWFKAGSYALPGGEPLTQCNLGIGLGCTQFSPSGRLLAVELVDFGRNERRIAVLDGTACTLQNLLTVEAGIVPALAFSEDERYLAYLGEDGASGGSTLRLWETRQFGQASLMPFGPQYHAVAVHSGTSRLAALGGGRCDIGLFAGE